MQHYIHNIHGAVVDVSGTGIVIINFFSTLFRYTSCHILNTDVESIKETQTRIRRTTKGASKWKLLE